MKIRTALFRVALGIGLIAITTLILTGCGGGNGGSPAAGGTGTTCAATSVPGTPSIYAVAHGNSSANVYFSAPISVGGYAIPIDSYIVTSSPGNQTATGTSIYSPITVNGLTNGTSYTFTIQAVNCLGKGSISTPSVSVTPSTVPGAPTGVSSIPGNAQASVSFTAPVDTGSAAITSYLLTASPGGQTVIGTTSPMVVLGLSNGVPYTFTVSAINVNGMGAASTPSPAVTPSVVPNGAPINVLATAGNAGASIAFTPPTISSGATVTGYTVTSSPAGITATGSASPIAITGLTNNVAYTFVVTAVYLGGTNATSLPSNSVIPIANPGPYFVNPATGSNANPGTSGLPFQTITYALSVANGVGTANTINAAAATYNTTSGETFPLRMVNNVNLTGAGSATTTIDGAGSYTDSSYSFPLITALVIAPNVTSTVSGFTITGGWQLSTYFTVIAVIDAATSGTLSNNVIFGPTLVAADGVWVINGANATLTSNTITGTGWNRGFGGLGILATAYGNPNVTARSNTISCTGDAAINVWGSGATMSPNVDLGTAASPGNNIINGPATSVGINIVGVANWINASGNIWHINLQGSSATGTYATGTVGINPAPLAVGNNYAIWVGALSAGLQF